MLAPDKVGITRSDWWIFAKYFTVIAVVFYISVWDWERVRCGSWRAAHQSLWKRPKRWQVITFCALWSFIIISFLILEFFPR